NALQPGATTRHRALVRIEDINPTDDPNELKAVADYLYSQGISFGFGVSPVYTDPLGYYNGGVAQTVRLGDKKNAVAGMIKYMQVIGEMFPYVVRDVYGTTVLPENLGDYEPEPFYQFPIHTVADILAAATAESVVRDGIASFYFHPFYGVTTLQQIVE